MMTCFFCQNLLSDFEDQMLPVKKYEEVKGHLKDCSVCRKLHENLRGLKERLKNESVKDFEAFYTKWKEKLSKPQVSLLRKFRELSIVSKLSLFLALALSSLYVSKILSKVWAQRTQAEEAANFSRYFPLLQGAQEILEEQSSFLQFRDNMNANVWEEGGISPEEFEKTFPAKTN